MPIPEQQQQQKKRDEAQQLMPIYFDAILRNTKKIILKNGLLTQQILNQIQPPNTPVYIIPANKLQEFLEASRTGNLEAFREFMVGTVQELSQKLEVSHKPGFTIEDLQTLLPQRQQAVQQQQPQQRQAVQPQQQQQQLQQQRQTVRQPAPVIQQRMQADRQEQFSASVTPTMPHGQQQNPGQQISQEQRLRDIEALFSRLPSVPTSLSEASEQLEHLPSVPKTEPQRAEVQPEIRNPQQLLEICSKFSNILHASINMPSQQKGKDRQDELAQYQRNLDKLEYNINKLKDIIDTNNPTLKAIEKKVEEMRETLTRQQLKFAPPSPTQQQQQTVSATTQPPRQQMTPPLTMRPATTVHMERPEPLKSPPKLPLTPQDAKLVQDMQEHLRAKEERIKKALEEARKVNPPTDVSRQKIERCNQALKRTQTYLETLNDPNKSVQEKSRVFCQNYETSIRDINERRDFLNMPPETSLYPEVMRNAFNRLAPFQRQEFPQVAALVQQPDRDKELQTGLQLEARTGEGLQPGGMQ